MKVFRNLVAAILTLTVVPLMGQKESDLVGAWEEVGSEGTKAVWIMAKDHFSIAYYQQEQFMYTEGGKWDLDNDGMIQFTWEFHTKENDKVGKQERYPIKKTKAGLSFRDVQWRQVDKGRPGKLAGAWLITGRQRNGEIRSRQPGARKTMKILSGTRFQWIAYNSETGEFMGTGGGTYTTVKSAYTERIEFFSRDNTRVGAELPFSFELKEGKWHHSGKSSKGDPIYEIWSTRTSLGI